MEDSNSTRLNKYISESGMCSRREADRFIEQGAVFINGARAKVGRRVFPGDVVMVNGNTIEPKKEEEAIYIAFNKPVGVVCTTEQGVKESITNYIRYGQRIFPIGRLDKDSQGLIFLTNNGDIVNKILRAGNNHEKEYLVTVNKPVTDEFVEAMSKGVPVLGTMTKKCLVEKVAATVFRIVLIQGLNRQIRRMCEYFNYDVVKLERVRIMNISLKGIPPGEWREFTKNEIDSINEMIRDSVATEDASKKKKKKTTTHNPAGNQKQQQQQKTHRPTKKSIRQQSNTFEQQMLFDKAHKEAGGHSKKNHNPSSSQRHSSGKRNGKRSNRRSGGR